MSDHETVARLLELSREVEAIWKEIDKDANHAASTKQKLREGATALLEVYVEERNNLPDSKFRKCYRCPEGRIERVQIKDAIVSRSIDGQLHNISVPLHSILRCTSCGNELLDGVGDEAIHRAMQEYMDRLPNRADDMVTVRLAHRDAVYLWEALTAVLGDGYGDAAHEELGKIRQFKEGLYDAIEMCERGVPQPR